MVSFSRYARGVQTSSTSAIPSSVRATYYRGGTSRAVMFRKDHLPADETTWPHIFRSVIGSPDPNGRQLNGMGGGISSLSKICVIGPSQRSDADVDYTFYQIGVKDMTIDTASNCGNMSAAVGPFALDCDLVTSGSEDHTTVRILNTNTSKIIHSTFPLTQSGILDPVGDFSIDGVGGTASKITLDFVNPSGSKTGKLLPTGKTIQEIDGLSLSCIDCGNPVVFVRASDLHIDGAILPDALDKRKDVTDRLEQVRRKAAIAMGMCDGEDEAPLAIPKIVVCSPPHRHVLKSGATLEAEQTDLVVRTMSSGQPHQAVPVTVSMAIAAAAELRGSVVAEVMQRGGQPRIGEQGLTIAHPTGRMVVGAKWGREGVIQSATVFTTARRLMEGVVFV